MYTTPVSCAGHRAAGKEELSCCAFSFHKLKEPDRGSPEPQRVRGKMTQQARLTRPVVVAAAALESRGPMSAGLWSQCAQKGWGLYIYRSAGA